MFDVVTIGNPSIDNFLVVDEKKIKIQEEAGQQFFVFPAGSKIPVTGLEKHLGGNAANVAVGLRRLGQKTAFVSHVGRDKEGFFVYKKLRKEGVSTRYVFISPNVEVNESTIVHYKGEKLIFSYHHDHHMHIKRIPRTKWIYLSSLGKDFVKVEKKALAYFARHPKTKLAYNPGSLELVHEIARVKKLIKKSDIVFLNKEEASEILKRKYSTATLLRSIQKMFGGIIAVTEGNKGASVFDGKKGFSAGTLNVKRVDATGAGDAFSSGFLSDYILHGNIETALYMASLNATEVIQQVGAQPGIIKKRNLNEAKRRYPKKDFNIKKLKIL